MPIEMTCENYKACVSETRLLVVPGAEHGMSYIVDKDGYGNAVTPFWNERDRLHRRHVQIPRPEDRMLQRRLAWPKKALYRLIILTGFLITCVPSHIGESLLCANLGFTYLPGYCILAALFINECRSVCENLVQAGIKAPALPTAGLAVAQKIIDGVVPEALKDAMQHIEPENDALPDKKLKRKAPGLGP